MNQFFSLSIPFFVVAALGMFTLSASQDKNQITEITFERTRCYGPCPAYKVILRHDGTATYIGQAYVERTGEYQGKIDQSSFIQLARLLESEGFFELKDSYTKPVTDNPSAITSVVRGDQRNRVSNYALAGPIKLWGMEMAIDAVVAHIKWEKSAVSAPPNEEQITEISLERTSCYGACPVYTVTLRRDGTARFIGKAHVERIGEYQGKVHLSDFILLARLLQSEGFFELKESYYTPVTDSSSAITSAVRGGQSKRVSNYALAGPIKLWAMEMAIDAVAAHIQWERAASPESNR